MGVVALLGGETCADHGFVGAGLTLCHWDHGESVLGFVEVLLQSPAVDECVRNVRDVLDAAGTHVSEQSVGELGLVVGVEGLEEGLVQAWLGSVYGRHGGVEHLASRRKVVLDATLGVNQ